MSSNNTNTTNTTNSAAKASGEKKPAVKKDKKKTVAKKRDKKSADKKPNPKKSAEKQPAVKKSPEKKPVENKPVEKKSAEKKSGEKKSPEKKKPKRKIPKNATLVHPGLFVSPTDPKHINLTFGQKMILQRYPPYFYPKCPRFDSYRSIPDQQRTPEILGSTVYFTKVHKKFYLFSHPMILEDTAAVKTLEKLRDKTHKLETGNTYSIPDVGYFKIDRKIGNNGYAATSKDPRFGKCYITFEAVGKDQKQMPCQFLDVRFYLSIKEIADVHRKHFLQMHCFGVVPDKYHWAVMELAGPNLNDLFVMCNKKWRRATSVNVAAQALQAIHDVQLHHHMHRCVDPSSFVVGVGDKHKVVYVINFSYSYEFTERTRAQRRGEPYSTDTPRVRWPIIKRVLFAPRSYHTGSPYRRIDDIESWYYMFTYFVLRGTSPVSTNLRDIYYQKCQMMYCGLLGLAPQPGWAGVMTSFLRGIDQYDETVNSTVDFPYFAACLEQFVDVMDIQKEELEKVEWMPSSKDPSIMVPRGGAFLDPVQKNPTLLARATLILPDEVQK